ncbi:hypothetical protein ACFQUX_24120 [Pantoea stewartii]|nr:hypothetical protein [Pantoea stewartii]
MMLQQIVNKRKAVMAAKSAAISDTQRQITPQANRAPPPPKGCG